MYAFHKEHIALFKLHPAAFVKYGLSVHEVEFRNYDFLAGKQVIEVLAEQFDIHRLESLVVLVAVFVKRGTVPFHEIVVEFYHFRGNPKHAALLGNPERAAGLAAGTRARHHHDACAVAVPHHLVSRIGIFSFLTGFAQVYQLYGIALGNNSVNIIH